MSIARKREAKKHKSCDPFDPGLRPRIFWLMVDWMVWNIFSTPLELAITSLAVALVGLSKGGLGGMSLLGVPLMALVMPPFKAASILLPVLIIMDIVSVSSWRGWVNWSIFRLLFPGALVGIAVGWATAEIVSDSVVRVIVGIVSLAFVLRAVAGTVSDPISTGSGTSARVWGGLAGYASFVAHAGAPPLQIYMIPLRLDPRLFTGTCVMFFAATNVIKLIPYAAMGGLDINNLARAGTMLPLAIFATYLGSWIVRHMRASVFYPFTYASVALVGLKLIWDGIAGI
ncbi:MULTISPECIES: sulfite exporter TauE/SafE family protein [unclassified Paracoccus (in: a-proteobacteria)]|uniref:sulfite exporter TauE/SafE family protein n=1 Tax=unclassified Paracoccus (in: a-proteobacteria) TaxID=2688777 RepID=UPI001FFDFBA2|nr:MULTISPECIES: sulfite exporter TauE/SafE family protein [unclassified Paracoccus (in: a-proteobacteria)]